MSIYNGLTPQSRWPPELISICKHKNYLTLFTDVVLEFVVVAESSTSHTLRVNRSHHIFVENYDMQDYNVLIFD